MATTVTARRRATLLGAALPAVAVGLLLCWWLATPSGPQPSAVSSAVALGAGSVLVGLGFLPRLGIEPPTAPIAAAGLIWLAAQLVTVWFDVAVRAGTGIGDVGVGQFLDGVSSAPGEVISGLAALAVVGWAAVWGRAEAPDVPVVAVGALAGLGIVATAVTGHAVTHSVEPILVAAHALCAAWWVGSLAALAMTCITRDAWRTALPPFSTAALIAVGVLTVTGLASGAIELGVTEQWWTTGYGRVMLAKAAVLGVLVALAGWHRRRWLPDVVARRVVAQRSLRSAVIEVAVLTVAVGLAAGLASTSPV